MQSIKNTLLKSKDHIILAITLVASLFFYLWYASLGNYKILYFDDSGSYFLAIETFLNGGIDALRTPGYPMICYLAEQISLPDTLLIISIFQEMMFLLSVVAAYNAMVTLNVRKPIAHIVTAAYALCPILFLYSNIIFTESLAISGTMFLICALANTVFGKHRTAMGIAAIMIIFLLIMLRPFFICFTPGVAIVMLYALYRHRTNKRFFATVCASGAIAASAILGYCYKYYLTYGTFAMSNVFECNRCWELYHWGFVSHIDGVKYFIYNSPADANGNVLTIDEAWLWKPSDQYLEQCEKAYEANKVRYIKNKILRFHTNTYDLYMSAPKQIAPAYYIMRHIKVYCGQIYWFTLAFAILELFLAIKRRKNIILSFALTSFVAATVFTTVWGADEQYNRLLIPMAPCLFVMVAIFLNRFNISTDNQNDTSAK